jgi:arginyl-tRNA synthetase
MLITEQAKSDVSEVLGHLKYSLNNQQKIIIKPSMIDNACYCCNIAMILASQTECNAMDLAASIVAELEKINQKSYKKIVISEPGFINFYVKQSHIFEIINELIESANIFQRYSSHASKKVLIECLNTELTAPLKISDGRFSAFLDSVANLLNCVGYKVSKQCFVDDLSQNLDIFTISIWMRYLELTGLEYEFPKAGFHGDYIWDVAANLHRQYGEQFRLELNDGVINCLHDELNQLSLINSVKLLLGIENYQLIVSMGLKSIQNNVRDDLKDFNIELDEYFYHHELYEKNEVQSGFLDIRKYQNLMKSQGYDAVFKIIDVQRYVNKAELSGSSTQADNKVLIKHYLPNPKMITQFVKYDNNYDQNKKLLSQVKSGDYVTLRQFRNKVGNDELRFYSALCKPCQKFDINQLKYYTPNSVNYIKYAIVRIDSLLSHLDENKIEKSCLEGLSELDSKQEKRVISTLINYELVVINSAKHFKPVILASYLKRLAKDFHRFYQADKIITDYDQKMFAKIRLIKAIHRVLTHGLSLLGIKGIRNK